jgi:hypothetical protein
MHNDPTFRDSQYSDPTEYQQPPQPIPAAYHNPYETLNPYDRGVPPPPPFKQRHKGLLVALISLLCVVMILGGVVFGVMLMRGQQQGNQLTPTVTSAATTSAPKSAATAVVTPIPTTPAVHSLNASANDIYNDFSSNGLNGVNVRSDNSWSCCTYIPEGGALAWTDSASGYTLDIAIFKNTNEATVDARELDSQNFASNVVRTCLLSYDNTVPGSVLNRYVQVMQTYCR